VVEADDARGAKWWIGIVPAVTNQTLIDSEFFGPRMRALLHTLCKSDIQAFTPEFYTIKVQDPALQSTKGGITIEAVCDRMLPAAVTVDYLFDQTHWLHRGFIHTRNACEMKFHYPPGLR
jgi:hypothetical protein